MNCGQGIRNQKGELNLLRKSEIQNVAILNDSILFIPKEWGESEDYNIEE